VGFGAVGWSNICIRKSVTEQYCRSREQTADSRGHETYYVMTTLLLVYKNSRLTPIESGTGVIIRRTLDSKSCTTLGAAALQYGATRFGRDAGAEAVRAGAVASVWLVGSFWHISGQLYPITLLFSRGNGCICKCIIVSLKFLSTFCAGLSTLLQM